MFTRQHYKAVAEIIARRLVDLADNAPGCAVKANLVVIAQELASYFGNDNPRFDCNKFMAACGLDG